MPAIKEQKEMAAISFMKNLDNPLVTHRMVRGRLRENLTYQKQSMVIGEDKLGDTSSEIGTGERPLERVSEFSIDVLGEGHVGGHNDELVVTTKGTTALIFEVYGIALEVFEKGGVRHTTLKLELIPTDDGVNPVSVTREPIRDVHVIDGVITLEGIDKGSLTGIGRTDKEKLTRFEGTMTAVSGDMIEEIYDDLVTLPRVVRTELCRRKARLYARTCDRRDTWARAKGMIGGSKLHVLELGLERRPTSDMDR